MHVCAVAVAPTRLGACACARAHQAWRVCVRVRMRRRAIWQGNSRRWARTRAPCPVGRVSVATSHRPIAGARRAPRHEELAQDLRDALGVARLAELREVGLLDRPTPWHGLARSAYVAALALARSSRCRPRPVSDGRLAHGRRRSRRRAHAHGRGSRLARARLAAAICRAHRPATGHAHRAHGALARDGVYSLRHRGCRRVC